MLPFSLKTRPGRSEGWNHSRQTTLLRSDRDPKFFDKFHSLAWLCVVSCCPSVDRCCLMCVNYSTTIEHVNRKIVNITVMGKYSGRFLVGHAHHQLMFGERQAAPKTLICSPISQHSSRRAYRYSKTKESKKEKQMDKLSIINFSFHNQSWSGL